MFQVLFVFMIQWNFLKLETGIIDSLSRQWSGIEEVVILNFRKILLKFAFFFENSWIVSFSELNDDYWPKKLLSLAHELVDQTPEKKMVLNFFHSKIWTSFKFCYHFFLYDWITNQARKLTDCRVEPHHGKYS